MNDSKDSEQSLLLHVIHPAGPNTSHWEEYVLVTSNFIVDKITSLLAKIEERVEEYSEGAYRVGVFYKDTDIELRSVNLTYANEYNLFGATTDKLIINTNNLQSDEHISELTKPTTSYEFRTLHCVATKYWDNALPKLQKKIWKKLEDAAAEGFYSIELNLRTVLEKAGLYDKITNPTAASTIYAILTNYISRLMNTDCPIGLCSVWREHENDIHIVTISFQHASN